MIGQFNYIKFAHAGTNFPAAETALWHCLKIRSDVYEAVYFQSIGREATEDQGMLENERVRADINDSVARV